MDQVHSDRLIASYKALKEEIAFRRRAEMVVAGGVLLVFTVCIFLSVVAAHFSNLFDSQALKIVLTILYVLIADVACYAQIKNYRRRNELKMVVSRLESVFGYFTTGEYIQGDTLYPQDWEKYGAWRQGGVYSRSIVIFLFLALCITATWAKLG